MPQNDNALQKNSPSIRPHSEGSSSVLPQPIGTPISIAVSETSAFTGVHTTSLQHDDLITTPISSPTGTSLSEDDLTDSPLHHHRKQLHNGYHSNNHPKTISFAHHNNSHQCKQQPSLLVTAEGNTSLDNKNVANSSCIMTPVAEGVLASTSMRYIEEDMDSTLLDSWNEAELIVPSTPADSDHVNEVITNTSGMATSSYNEVLHSPTVLRPKPTVVRPKPTSTDELKAAATKPVKSKSGSNRKKRRSHQLQADSSDSSISDHIPPASVTTAPGLKPWQSNTKKVNNHLVTMPTVLQSSDPLVTMAPSTTRADCTMEESSSSVMATSDNCTVIDEHHTMPLSNSPIDIIVMLCRMAAFCASMTKVLSPKLPVNVSLPTGIVASHGVT